MALRHLSTEDLITELFRFGIEVTEEERSKFKGKVFEFLISVCGVVNSKLEVNVNFYCVSASQVHNLLCQH